MGVFLDFDKIGHSSDPVCLDDIVHSKAIPDFALGVLLVREKEHPSIHSTHVIFPHCEITLGRLTSNDVITYNSYSSRKHAAVFSSLHQVYVRDLESLNGTYLNGKLVDADRQLQNGDVLELGSSRITFKRF